MSNLAQTIHDWKVEHEHKQDVSDAETKAIQGDPIEYLESDRGYYVKEIGRPIKFEEWEKVLLRKFLSSNKKRRVIADIKKNLKTSKTAAIFHYEALRAPKTELYIIANDLNQAQSRAFHFVKSSVEMNPYCSDVKTYGTVIQYPNGSFIKALPRDYKGEAGANPRVVSFDEIWGATSEGAARMVEEFTIPPSQPDGYQLFTSYAGFENDASHTKASKSHILKQIYDEVFERDASGQERVRSGVKQEWHEVHWENGDFESQGFYTYETDTLLLYWGHGPLEGHPGQQWHTRSYFNVERDSLRAKQFLRLHRNRWVTGTEESIFDGIWDECVAASVINAPNLNIINQKHTPPLPTKEFPLAVGVDGATHDDHCAAVSLYSHPIANKPAVGPRKFWKPINTPAGEMFDLSETVKQWLIDLDRQYWVYAVFYDPYQLHQVAVDLIKDHGINMMKYNQTGGNLTDMCENMLGMVKFKQLLLLDDPELKMYADNVIASEGVRGWKFEKKGQRDKIDGMVALAMAAMAYTQIIVPVFGNNKPQDKSEQDNNYLEKFKQKEIDRREKEYHDRMDVGIMDFVR